MIKRIASFITGIVALTIAWYLLPTIPVAVMCGWSSFVIGHIYLWQTFLSNLE